MFSRLLLFAQIGLVVLFAYAQYHGLSFLGSDEERTPPGSSRASFHK